MEQINSNAEEQNAPRRTKLIGYDENEYEIEVMKNKEEKKRKLNLKKKEINLFIILKMVIVVALIAGALIYPLPRGGYGILKLVVCSIASFYTYFYYEKDKPVGNAVIASFAITIVFNPFFPVRMPMEMWRTLDLVLSIALIVSIAADRKMYKTIG